MKYEGDSCQKLCKNMYMNLFKIYVQNTVNFFSGLFRANHRSKRLEIVRGEILKLHLGELTQGSSLKGAHLRELYSC